MPEFSYEDSEEDLDLSDEAKDTDSPSLNEDSEEDLVLSDEAKDKDSSSLNEDTEEDADSFNFNEPDTIQHTAAHNVEENEDHIKSSVSEVEINSKYSTRLT